MQQLKCCLVLWSGKHVKQMYGPKKYVRHILKNALSKHMPVTQKELLKQSRHMSYI